MTKSRSPCLWDARPAWKKSGGAHNHDFRSWFWINVFCIFITSMGWFTVYCGFVLASRDVDFQGGVLVAIFGLIVIGVLTLQRIFRAIVEFPREQWKEWRHARQLRRVR